MPKSQSVVEIIFWSITINDGFLRPYIT